jgi:hypothetical protein
MKSATASHVRYLALMESVPAEDASAGVLLEHWQQIRAAALEALNDHLSKGAGGSGRARLPDDIALAIRSALQAALQDARHPLFSNDAVIGPHAVRSSRGNRRTPSRSEQVTWAVAYITLCDQCVISDRSARETVRRRYGVTKRQVYRWLSEVGDMSARSIAVTTLFAERGIAGNVDSRARVTRKLMRVNADRYRRSRL